MAIAKFFSGLLAGKEIELYANGKSSRDYTFVDDIVEGILLSLISLNGYNIFNLGGSESITLFDLLQLIQNISNVEAKIKLLPIQKGDVNQTFADISKAKKYLNWYPQTKIEAGLKKYYNWFLELPPEIKHLYYS